MENTAGCLPPSMRTCDPIGCYCVTPTTIPTPKPFPLCTPPETAICHGFDCHCGVAPSAPAATMPAVMPDDGCAIVATVIVVGIKKMLVACWVGG